MAYMLSANMDQGAIDFQLEAAISKVYASVSNKNLLDFQRRFRDTITVFDDLPKGQLNKETRTWCDSYRIL